MSQIKRYFTRIVIRVKRKFTRGGILAAVFVWISFARANAHVRGS